MSDYFYSFHSMCEYGWLELKIYLEEDWSKISFKTLKERLDKIQNEENQ